jgi:hypothetical protein
MIPLDKRVLNTRMDRFEQVVLEHIDKKITAKITTLSDRIGSLDKRVETIRKIVDKHYSKFGNGGK